MLKTKGDGMHGTGITQSAVTSGAWPPWKAIQIVQPALQEDLTLGTAGKQLGENKRRT